MPPPPPSDRRERRFFLRTTPEDGEPELEPEEVDHVLRVLRMGVGDELIGLDGRGGAWPLTVRRAERRRIELASTGPAEREPRPGEPGAALPWIEAAVAFPKPPRAEDMVDRLCQLGVAAVTPLACERSHPRTGGERQRQRLERVARAACKQAGRLWLPELGEPASPEAWLEQRREARVLHLDPRAERSLPELLSADAAHERPLALVVGPEGGFSPAEQELLDAAGALRGRLGPHVLRIATAAEAAAAVAVALRSAARG